MNLPYLLKSCASLFVVGVFAFSHLCAASQKPNVVIIYGDDVGFGDVGVYGAELIPTPNIDQLAAGGLRFTDGHCSAATCTPSRYSMLTGVYGFRDDVSILPPNAPLSISTEILTLPKLFQQAGYTTGVVGKWHLGIGAKGVPTDWNGKVSPGPLEIGFDFSFLLPSTNDRVPCVYLDGHYVLNLDPADPLFVGGPKIATKPGSTHYPDGKKNREAMTYYQSTHGHDNSVINGIGRIGYMAGGKSALWDDETIADVFVEKADAFIREHKDEPFFLYFASQDIHVPRAPHPRFQGSTSLSYRGDAMVQFDWTVGQIMKVLEANGLAENTIVIFSSDNGPVYDDGYDDGTTFRTSTKEVDRGHDGSGPFSGGKYQIFEGGHRVPFIIRWPARIKPGVSDALVSQIDFLASFASMLELGIADGEAADSRDMLPALLGEDQLGLPYTVGEAQKDLYYREGPWKYVLKRKRTGETAKEMLFNLDEDIAEKNNVLSVHPERAEQMSKQLQTIIEQGHI